MNMPSSHLATDTLQGAAALSTWTATLSSSLRTLHRLAGTTEREFLQIGSQMQVIYHHSAQLSSTAQQLAEIASGARLDPLIDQLRQILTEMENYLGQTQNQSNDSCTTLATVNGLLMEVGEPLEGFRRMSKQLYILEVLIKIESSYLGDMGGEIINLALDIKKLSQQVKEKAAAIHQHRLSLTTTIDQNIGNIDAAMIFQEQEVRTTLAATADSLAELDQVNNSFSALGQMVSTISTENSAKISGIVQSMQFHDIFRQQVEHVIEALEALLPSLHGLNDEEAIQAAIASVGDVCELQEAQLNFAAAELFAAVASIVDNLQDIGGTQHGMAEEIYRQTGNIGGKRGSFIDGVSGHMETITSLLTKCAATNSEIITTVKDVGSTVAQITAYVADIEEIGHEIIQIALNARIKASATGTEGDSLSVLAEEIGQLSKDAVDRTNSITATLTEIHTATADLTAATDHTETNLTNQLEALKTNSHTVLATLDGMGTELYGLLEKTQGQVASASREIKTTTSRIDIHHRTKAMADEVLSDLQQIFGAARQLHPASTEFKEGLRQLAQSYTMESERRIHEDIARKHGVITESSTNAASSQTEASDSEFGDNVDLF